MSKFKPKVKNKYNNLIQEYETCEENNLDIKFKEYSFNSGIRRRGFSYKRVISSRNRNYNNMIEIDVEEYYEK